MKKKGAQLLVIFKYNVLSKTLVAPVPEIKEHIIYSEG